MSESTLTWRPYSNARDARSIPCHRCGAAFPAFQAVLASINGEQEYPLCLYCYTSVRRIDDQMNEELSYIYDK